jgi:hypothetical protein
MTKLLASAAAAILFAGFAYAGEPEVEGEIVEVEVAGDASDATDAEAVAVEAPVEAEGEVGPAQADADNGVTEEAAAE